MKNGILIILRPFTFKQKYFLFDKNGDVILENNLPYDKYFVKDMVCLAHQNNVDKINISGPYGYAIKMHNEIMEYNNSQFDENSLQVNILSKKS